MKMIVEKKTLDLLPRRMIPRNYNNIELTQLYKNVKPIATLNNDIMDLLLYILPVHYNYLKSTRIRKLGKNEL